MRPIPEHLSLSERIIGPTEAAELLKTSTTTVRSLALRGKLPSIQTRDYKLLFLVEDVQRLVDAGWTPAPGRRTRWGGSK